MAANSWTIPVSRQYFSKQPAVYSPPPVRAKIPHPHALRIDNDLDKLFERTPRIALFFDEKYLLSLAVLVRELADVTESSKRGRRYGPEQTGVHQLEGAIGSVDSCLWGSFVVCLSQTHTLNGDMLSP